MKMRRSEIQEDLLMLEGAALLADEQATDWQHPSEVLISCRGMLHSWRMDAHSQDAEAGSEGHPGTGDPFWAEPSPCPVPLRRRPSRTPEDRGAGRPAAPTGAPSEVPWITRARRPSHEGCDPAGGAADQLAREGPAAAGEVSPRACGILSGEYGYWAGTRPIIWTCWLAWSVNTTVR